MACGLPLLGSGRAASGSRAVRGSPDRAVRGSSDLVVLHIFCRLSARPEYHPAERDIVHTL
jgi:hypothetical protein